MNNKEHGRRVLGGVIPARIDLFSTALKELTAEHFSDTTQVAIWKFLEYYYQKTGGVLTKGALSDILTRTMSDPGRIALYEETFADLFNLKVDDMDFMWSIHELKEDYASQKLTAALVKAAEITTTGVEQKGGEILKGQEDAREFLAAQLSDIEVATRGMETPHGNMRDEADLIKQEYQAAKNAYESGTQTGVQFGIAELDEKVGGLQRGDLALSAAYTNDGKTTLCVQLAWSAVVEQGKNVLFLSTETVNTVIRRRLIARHSKNPKFQDWNLPDGLNSKALKNGTLSPHEEEFFDVIRLDFANRKNDYGELEIYQLPEGSSMSDVRQVMMDTQKKFPIDLVVCDYLQLLRATARRDTNRESLSDVIKGAKQVAVAFNKGQGVPFISPWQVNRAAKEQADHDGRYTTMAMAETAEAANTPDIIVSLLAPVDNTDRYANLAAQVLKHRDGETADGIQLAVDYATCHFSSRGTLDTFSSAPSAGGFGGIDSLIN